MHAARSLQIIQRVFFSYKTLDYARMHIINPILGDFY